MPALEMRRVMAGLGAGLLLVLGLYAASRYSYLLFHSLVELVAVAVGAGIFFIAWNTRTITQNSYFRLLGVASLAVAGLHLLHALAYEGMGVLPSAGGNVATQFWVAARFMESGSLVLAALALERRVHVGWALVVYVALFAGVVASILVWPVFPDSFVAGVGLTPFKRAIELVICGLFVAAFVLLHRRRHAFDREVRLLLSAAIGAAVVGELAFTLYAGVFDSFNLAGHFLVLASFYFTYRALIRTVLARPYRLLFRELKQSEEALRRARDDLDARVQERTATLAHTVNELEAEIVRRKRLERQVLETSEAERRRIGQDLHDSLGQNLTGVGFLASALAARLQEASPEHARAAADIAQVVQESIKQARLIARGLSPVSMQADGLMTALAGLAAMTTEVAGIDCVFSCDEPVLLADPSVATHLFRIAQEATNNAVKHGRAAHIDIALAVEDGRLALRIQDDGVGLPADLDSSRGMGLHTIRYRADVIAAAAAVLAGPHGGTLVTCTLALPAAGSQDVSERAVAAAEGEGPGATA